MNKKAQASFDVMLAIVFAIIFIAALGLISQQIISLQNEAGTRIQMKQIALNCAELVSSAQAMNETTATFQIDYNIPALFSPAQGKTDCVVTFLFPLGSDGIVQVQHGNDVNSTASFIAPIGVQINNFVIAPNTEKTINCGEKLTIKK